MSALELAPTADVPTVRTKKDDKPNPVWDGPCPTCGAWVLTGETRAGVTVVAERAPQTIYVVVWQDPKQPPQMSESRGYLKHECQGVAKEKPWRPYQMHTRQE